VVETTLGDLKTRLTAGRGLSPDASKAFVRSFSIFHRSAWDKPPPGFRNRDLNPWRFRRRLSATARPILVFGEEDDDKVFYGAGTLSLGFVYLLERSRRGHLPQEFFTSAEMRQYIGATNSERGHAFARSVADQLRENGWEARNEVQITELGGSAELGDVDVLAWKPSGEIQLIECKRLQLARTVAEVAEICRRFRGEAKDDLDKHIRRVDWIRANPAGVERIVGFVPDPDRIDDRLVTNTHVPMMYLSSLPIEADKIGPLK
jgi:Holliday junction resolvase